MRFYVVICENDGYDTDFACDDDGVSVFTKRSDALDLRDILRKSRHGILDGWKYTVLEANTINLKVV